MGGGGKHAEIPKASAIAKLIFREADILTGRRAGSGVISDQSVIGHGKGCERLQLASYAYGSLSGDLCEGNASCEDTHERVGIGMKEPDRDLYVIKSRLERV